MGSVSPRFTVLWWFVTHPDTQKLRKTIISGWKKQLCLEKLDAWHSYLDLAVQRAVWAEVLYWEQTSVEIHPQGFGSE